MREIYVADMDYLRKAEHRAESGADTTPEQYAAIRGLTDRQVSVARRALERIRAHVLHRRGAEAGGTFEGVTASDLIADRLPGASPQTRRAVEVLAIKLADEEGLYRDLRYGGQPAVDRQTEAEIRRRYNTEEITQGDLGAEYGLSPSTISKIVRCVGCYGEEAA